MRKHFLKIPECKIFTSSCKGERAWSLRVCKTFDRFGIRRDVVAKMCNDFGADKMARLVREIRRKKYHSPE